MEMVCVHFEDISSIVQNCVKAYFLVFLRLQCSFCILFCDLFWIIMIAFYSICVRLEQHIDLL